MPKKILVTSALPYVNNIPHLGNIIGCVLSADVFARFSRARGYDTLFICGTDEHGTATETKALEEGLTPQQICDKYHKVHKEVYDWFGCSFDAFGRTSTKTHEEVTQGIFKRLYEKGFIVKDVLEQTYCPKCDKFLADRFVEGTCPHCGHEGARGDQCQHCDKLLNPVELINSKCKVCATKPVLRKSNHLFLDLPKLGPKLKAWIDRTKDPGFWTQNARTVTEAWFTEGLKMRCITRDLKWGIPVPLEGYENKVFYVWFDAPIGYLSITKHALPDEWESWWKSDDVLLYQFMAKDNIPFHTILFPSTLIGTGEKWTMLHHIDSTEYLNYEDGKFSKSASQGVFGDDAKNTGVPADVWRYYLLSGRPESSDSQFSWKEFQDKNNNELLSNLGNFVNRTLTFVQRYFDSTVPRAKLTERDDKLIVEVGAQEKKVIELLEGVKERDALKEIMHISRLGNQYFQDSAPWTLVKPVAAAASKSAVPPRSERHAANESSVAGDAHSRMPGIREFPQIPEICLTSGEGHAFVKDKDARAGGTRAEHELFDAEKMERCATIMNVCCNLVRTLAVLIEPFLPNTSKEIFNQLNLNGKDVKLEYKMHLDLKPGHKIAEPKVLFRKLEDKEIAEFKKRFAGKKTAENPASPAAAKFEKFPLELKVAKVLNVKDHPEAEKLYILQVDLGHERRQLVAGMKPYISKEELTGRNIIVVCNIKPAKLRGVESNGMLLAADDGKHVSLLEAKQSDPGDEVAVEGVESDEKFRQLEISEFGKISLVTDESHHVVCENFGRKLKTPFEYVVARNIAKGARIR